ncbi:hypothetical protein UIS43_18475 [Nocardiopsis sp. LDBS0036]|uniref:hypothetical protein n=1 Tax=Nocardiopsis sp. LDBS0036 TaxID=3104276 RepID=UPI003510EA67
MVEIISWSDLSSLMERFYSPKGLNNPDKENSLRLECDADSIEIFNSDDEKVFSLTLEEYSNSLNLLEDVGIANGSDLFWGESCEIHTRMHSRFPGSAAKNIFGERVMDKENGLTYEFGEPSVAYALYKISYFQSGGYKVGPLMDYPSAIRLGGPRAKLARPGEGSAYFLPYGNSKTLRISAEKPRSSESFYNFANSFLFQVAYTFDVALIPSMGFDYLLRSGRFVRLRRGGSQSTMEAPLRSYNKTLVHNYQLAIAAENPFLEFVSYYQIMEHFFEQVFSDHVVNMVREEISSPNFSLKRKVDVRSLVKKIERASYQRREDGGGNETKAIGLVLEKYVDVDRLREDIAKFENSLIKYYEENSVPFSGGVTIPFSGGDRKKIIGAMGKRIYDTRNALVHAKEGGKPRFLPFKDDGDLAREVPMMRLIAEQVLIGEGDLLR